MLCNRIITFPQERCAESNSRKITDTGIVKLSKPVELIVSVSVTIKPVVKEIINRAGKLKL